MVDHEIQPKDPPALHLPQSDSIVQVHIINSTAELVVATESLVDQNKTEGKSILFDNGARKDWWNFSPFTLGLVRNGIPALNVVKDVHEILTEGGVDTRTISSIIWSHWHWDHIGNVALFDKSTEIVVGPGFKDAFLPGYPTKANSPMLDTDF
ncbi:hypothetical protein MMC29_008168, partial [Sticta canariensis]|nr:hypothetical protein [Sticta canariensis]